MSTQHKSRSNPRKKENTQRTTLLTKKLGYSCTNRKKDNGSRSTYISLEQGKSKAGANKLLNLGIERSTTRNGITKLASNNL
mmetsp:Transcript_33410/g.76990  ORF Transcript_33410/g.76990 Transcript_33410/m.76990 type:complete len:82 (-) Transcript_33410:1235-1480(-)